MKKKDICPEYLLKGIYGIRNKINNYVYVGSASVSFANGITIGYVSVNKVMTTLPKEDKHEHGNYKRYYTDRDNKIVYDL